MKMKLNPWVCKFIILSFACLLPKKPATVGVTLATAAITSALSQEFVQSFLSFMGVTKPLVAISLWVMSMVVYSSIPSLTTNNPKLIWPVVILSLFLTMSFTAKTMVIFYLFLESTIIPTVLMIFTLGNQPERLKASTYLVMYTIFSSTPLLIAIGVMMNAGSVSLISPMPTTWVTNNSLLLFCQMMALLVKTPTYPLHVWLPKAHVEAPLMGSMALAGILLKLGTLGMMKMLTFTVAPQGAFSFIVATSLWGGLCTSMSCIRQTDMKSLIAYSSVGHMALVTVGVMTCSEFGMKGAMIVAISHALSSPAMLSMAAMIQDITFSRSIMVCRGVFAVLPTATMMFFIVSAASMAAPPLISLIGEILLFISIMSMSKWSFLTLVAISLASAAYTLTLLMSMSHGSPSTYLNPSLSLKASSYLIVMIQVFPMLALAFNVSLML